MKFTESHLLVFLSDLNYDCAIYKRIAVAWNSKPRQKKILFKTQMLCLKCAYYVYMQMRMTDKCCKLPQEGVLSNFSSRFSCVVQWRICIDWVKLGSLGFSRQFFFVQGLTKILFLNIMSEKGLNTLAINKLRCMI